jgi:type III restriction enzyme
LTVIANETFENFARGLQSEIEQAIDPDGGFRFGRIPRIAFTQVLNPEKTGYLTQEESTEIWQCVAEQNLIDSYGDLTQQFQPGKPGFALKLPEKYVGLENDVIIRMQRFVPRDFVKNGRDRKKLEYNKRVELNEDFRKLWDKISQKTRYSVVFSTDDLIKHAAGKIGQMAEIQPVFIEITRRDLEIKESGLEGGRITANKIHLVSNEQPLPDILAFLQQETELTRGTLVSILKQSGRMKEFAINPQGFMTETAKLINRALQELIIDGIKYEPIDGQYYEMRMFEEPEIEEYLNRLYVVQHMELHEPDKVIVRTPYCYVSYDSDVEHEIAERLDADERVKFFCKLPRWFRVATPLGDYNPDWAVVVEEDEKLYLVRETKSTLDRDKRRTTENRKVDCGKAHFQALGVNFKDASTIYEVLKA